jgi:signal transduction histidine kinase
MSVRSRLTLLYGGLFLLSGTGLLAIVYLLVVTEFPDRYTTGDGIPPGASGPVYASDSVRSASASQHAAQVHQLLIQSGIALGVMAVAAVGLGWLVAGRILRPLRAITATTRQISEDNLHHRLAAGGPPDELKDLADTIDGLLARLEAAFEAQRRFVANASHELRTPLTLERAMLEVALADPDASADSLRATCEEVLVAGRYQERLIEALLTLARGQRGLDHREPVDLAAVTGEALRARPTALAVRAALAPARASGDPRLLERLVANLVDNAIRYNVAGGEVAVVTGTRDGQALLSVANTGPPVPADEVDRLLQPFQRLATDRSSGTEGVGLGLSIVAAIAKAHGAALVARPAPGGGLRVDVRLPALP